MSMWRDPEVISPGLCLNGVGCVLDTFGDTSLPKGLRYNLVKYMVESYRRPHHCTTPKGVTFRDVLPAACGVALPF